MSGMTEANWQAADSVKWAGEPGQPNEVLLSAVVSDGVVDLTTDETDDVHMRGLEKGAFQFCSKLRSVELPESLRRLGHGSFDNCKSLMHVEIPAGVSELGNWTFRFCNTLRTVILPEGISMLPIFLFYGCESLVTVGLPSSLRTIGERAFESCPSLVNVNFSHILNVTDIGIAAFCGCGFTQVALPPLVKSVPDDAFSCCGSLSKVALPDGLETIGEGAFNNCHPSLSIDVPQTVRSVGFNAFRGCRIRLPLLLPMLSNGEDIVSFFQGTKEAVLSSRVDLNNFVAKFSAMPETDEYGIPLLDPGLKLKILYGGSAANSKDDAPVPPPLLKEHVPESFFCWEATPKELVSLHADGGERALFDKMQSLLSDKLSVFVDILGPTSIPEEILHSIMPYVCNDDMTDDILGDFVIILKKLLQKKVPGRSVLRKEY